MSVKARRARVDKADAGHCPHCGVAVIEATSRRSGRMLRVDPTPVERGSLRVVTDGAVFVEFINPADRDPKSPRFVPPAERYQSHQVTCAANERTLSVADAEFIEKWDKRMERAS